MTTAALIVAVCFLAHWVFGLCLIMLAGTRRGSTISRDEVGKAILVGAFMLPLLAMALAMEISEKIAARFKPDPALEKEDL